MVGAINAAWSNAPAAKDQMGAVVRTTARTIQTNALLYGTFFIMINMIIPF